MDKNEARAQILLSGSGDYVSLAEAADYVRDDHPDASAATVKNETLKVIADLVATGLAQLGELSDGFLAWDQRSAVAFVEQHWTKSDRDLAPWDGIWLSNTAAGDRLADQLAEDGKVTRS